MNANQPLEDLVAHSTILLAEDDNDDAFLMRRAFRKAHLLNPIVRVYDGEEAIAYLSGTERYSDRERFPLPFLLLLDLKMPKVDGLEVLRWLQTQPQFKEMLKVILTASTHQRDVTTAYELGANSYLSKPAGFDELIDLLKRLKSSWLMTSSPDEIDACSAKELQMAH
jgi:CheY-like chemotaxis protein